MDYKSVKALYDGKGYIFHTGKNQANLFGLRNADLKTVDLFNDALGVAYLDGYNVPQCLLFAGTTKPGLASLAGEPMNKEGTFILAPGQHLNSWMVGYHHAGDPVKQYEAFQQRAAGVFKGWRDSDKDGQCDFGGKIYTDAAGVNGHRAGINDTLRVGPYGFGCQVVQEDKEHLIWLSIGKLSAEKWGNSLHYTLFQL